MGARATAITLFRSLARLVRLESEFYAVAGRRAGFGDFTRQRGELLCEIRLAGGRLQVQDAAERSGRNKSATAELVAKLCNEGYAFKLRVADDGRGVWVVLSAKGRRAADAYSRATADLERVVSGSSPPAALDRMLETAGLTERAIGKSLRQ